MEELRNLLSQKPSEEVWEGICDLLDTVEDEKLLEEMIEVCEEGLAGWPDELRISRQRWHLSGYCNELRRKTARVRILLDLSQLVLPNVFSEFNTYSMHIQAISCSETRGLIAVAASDGTAGYIIVMDEASSNLIFSHKWSLDYNEDFWPYCNHLEFFDDDLRLIAVWISNMRDLGGQSKTLIWENDQLVNTIDEKHSFAQGKLEPMWLCTLIDEGDRNLFQWNSISRTLRVTDLDSFKVLRQRAINDQIFGMDLHPAKYIAVYHSACEMQMYRKRTLNKIGEVQANHESFLPIVRSSVNIDAGLACSITIYDEVSEELSGNSNPYGGVFFWITNSVLTWTIQSTFGFPRSHHQPFFASNSCRTDNYKGTIRALVLFRSESTLASKAPNIYQLFKATSNSEFKALLSIRNSLPLDQWACINSRDNTSRILVGIRCLVMECLCQ